jgi:hypothetical protein
VKSEEAQSSPEYSWVPNQTATVLPTVEVTAGVPSTLAFPFTLPTKVSTGSTASTLSKAVMLATRLVAELTVKV